MTARLLKWLALLVLLALIAWGGWRAYATRQAQAQALAQAGAAREQTVVELAPTDVARAAVRQLTRGLPISGSLKAVNSAVVKARVAGELQGLVVREGDLVRAGQVIARIESTEYTARLQQAQQQADAARAQIDIAQRQWENNKALVEQGFISKTAADTSLNNLDGARATHKAALAAVDMAGKSVADATMRAPITGVVSQRLAQPGERVAVETRIVEIVDLSRLELEAALSPADSVAVRVGQEAVLQVEGMPRPVHARVARINPSAQAGSRTVLAYLGVDNAQGLRQGLFAQGTLETGDESALSVPLSAVRTDKPAPYVQVIENDRVAHRSIELGSRGEADQEAMVAVTGVAPGAAVLRGSVGPLREGTAVRFTPQPVAPARSASAAKTGL
jgi:RND family efflux transporter MFP subunit